MKVAVIGTGSISDLHISGYLGAGARCRVTAVCDIVPEKAEAKIRKHGLTGARACSNYTDLLSSDIDLVSICTPPYTHAQIAIDFLSAGKHVLVEKPMASSLEECDAMIAAARASGKILSVVAQNRFRTPMMKLKSVLDAGLAGRIVHAQVDSFWWRGRSYYDLWWRGTWEKEGGGCTLNHAVHHIDALIWLAGRPSEVTAIMGNVAHNNSEVEDLSMALVKFSWGALGQITSSVVHHGEEQQLVFQGTAARISFPWKVTASRSQPNGFPEPDPVTEETIRSYYESLPELRYELHAGQIDNVLSAIETGTPVLIDGEAGRAPLELIAAIYRSASSGQRVTLPLPPSDPFYTREGILANAVRFHEKSANTEGFGER
jgi:UDP-N-acetyl-2-amino-2-deoxyglucuronate dehydrogenase